MILRYQCINVHEYHISTCVFLPFFHNNTPVPILPETEALG